MDFHDTATPRFISSRRQRQAFAASIQHIVMVVADRLGVKLRKARTDGLRLPKIQRRAFH